MDEPAREGSTSDEQPRKGDDRLVRREENAAAREAAGIGGPPPPISADEASRPVVEAGGGDAEGFEDAEKELTEQASHGENRWDPETDAFTPEREADRASAVYGEPDEIDPTEVTRDPREGEDDPGEGPGITADR